MSSKSNDNNHKKCFEMAERMNNKDKSERNLSY